MFGWARSASSNAPKVVLIIVTPCCLQKKPKFAAFSSRILLTSIFSVRGTGSLLLMIGGGGGVGSRIPALFSTSTGLWWGTFCINLALATGGAWVHRGPSANARSRWRKATFLCLHSRRSLERLACCAGERVRLSRVRVAGCSSVGCSSPSSSTSSIVMWNLPFFFSPIGLSPSLGVVFTPLNADYAPVVGCALGASYALAYRGRHFPRQCSRKVSRKFFQSMAGSCLLSQGRPSITGFSGASDVM